MHRIAPLTCQVSRESSAFLYFSVRFVTFVV
jgi:hypothetical protein